VHEALEYAEVRERNKVRIKTKVGKRDVYFRDNYPDKDPMERKIFKYYCPICLRYFNAILVSTCCDNYICRFCIGDLAKKAKNDTKFKILCSHCMTEEYKLVDVDPDAPLRIYTDTPFKLESSCRKSHATPAKFSIEDDPQATDEVAPQKQTGPATGCTGSAG
jgi:hypothetical protein